MFYPTSTVVTGAESCWGKLSVCRPHTSELASPQGEGSIYISSPVSHWLKAAVEAKFPFAICTKS